MDITKRGKIESLLLFLFLVVFPFGQLFGKTLDFIVGIIFLYTFFFKLEKPKIFKYLFNFVYLAGFSFVLALFLFHNPLVYTGGLYLLRLIFYLYFAVFCFNFVKRNKVNKNLVLNCLVLISITTAFLGWIQYFFFPDFRPFLVYGWDEHLFRLVGTFFDPGFTAIIFVLGIILTIYKYLKTKNKTDLILLIFLLISLAFTYSRAGYLALLVGMVYIAFSEKRIKKMLLMGVFFGLLLLVLPKPAGEGVKLSRTASIIARLENYREIIKISQTNPLFGVGFNNLCYAKQIYLNKWEKDSHSCFGSDSSPLLVLATTGMAGMIIFIYALVKIIGLIEVSYYRKVFLASGVTLLVHSFFTNSLFYPWVMAYFGLLLATVKFKENN